MPNGKTNLTIWVIIGVVIGAAIIYFAVQGNVLKQSGKLTAPPGETKVIVPGASPVSDKGEVLAPSGEVAKNNAPPGSADAPQQSQSITKEEIPSAAIKLAATRENKFQPASFDVKAGQLVILSVTSGDSFTYVFKFDDPSLSGIAVGIAPQETRAITFTAPEKKGEYTFRSDVPGHVGLGLVGKMVVK